MARKLLIGVLLVVSLGYLAALATLFAAQRSMMYFPSHGRDDAAASGFEGASTLSLPTPDGETLVAWYRAPAKPDRPMFLFFHGNGGALADRVSLLRRLCDDGSGVLAIDYRGYGGSTGAPSEGGLLVDGATAYAAVRALGHPATRIVVIGESLGSGVAVAVAARQPVHALVLDSAFSSAADVAAERYPIFPVHLMMRDPFDSAAVISGIKAPKLFLYGDKDSVIPRPSALKLFTAASEPKTLIELPELGHVVLLTPAVLVRVEDWLAKLPR